MAIASGSSIEAVLTLNASGFHSQLEKSTTAVKDFVAQANSSAGKINAFTSAIDSLFMALEESTGSLVTFNNQAKGIESFNKFANGVKSLATAVQTLGTDASTSAVGMQRVIRLVESMQGTLGSTVIEVKGLATAMRDLARESELSAQKTANAFKQAQADLMNMASSIQQTQEKTRRVQEQTTAMGNEFKKAQSDLMNFANTGVSEFHSVDTTLNELRSALRLVDEAIAKERASFSSMSNATAQGRQNLALYHQNLKALALGVEQFNAIETKSTSSINQNTNATRQAIATDEQYRTLTLQTEAMLQRKMELLQRNSEAMRQNGAETLRAMGYKGRLSVEEEKLALSEEKQSIATDKATNSMRRQETASKGLKNALSSLKMMGTMVGSMIAYNFVHNLAMATTETINAKSEMNGYFQMLGYTTRQVDGFNKALDDTVKKFPRLNKYALGETISSIGVEFELTTKEMEKAMPVVSMITSEYLRAGRNVNEASLAVKDILQGEFQRLSRETGVKGDQLKEAGWSGDKSDVMGLLEALEKVGKERNWDTFVQKANSLNDAVLITQNRFSEWSADMVERVQPAILNVFNTIMIVAQDFAKVINGALDWLSGDGIGQSIVKWGGLALAIGNVVSGLIVYRTGANLTQIAQMGLTRSIGATILGLEAETVAEYGLRTSLIANITHMKAEEVARQGRLNSITATITGLKAEEVAEMGKARALASSLLGLDMATVKEYGFLTALGSATTGIKVQEFALKSHRTQLLLTIGSVTALAGALLILTGYFVIQAIKINDSIEKYNKFRNTLEHGDEVVKEHKDTVDTLTKKQEELNEKLQTLDKSSYEYALTQNKLKTVTDELGVANQNYADSVNAVAWAKHKQELYDSEKQEKSLQTQKEINQALIDYGVSVKDANEIASPIWSDTIDGWNQQYETLQRVNHQQEKNAISIKYHLDELNKKKIDPKEAQILIKPLIKSGNKIADAKEELGQSTSLTEYVDKWLWLQVAQIQHSIEEFNFNIHIDWGKAIKGIFKGLSHGYEGLNLPVPSLTDWIIEKLGLEGKGLQSESLPVPSLTDWIIEKLGLKGKGLQIDSLEDLGDLPDPAKMIGEWVSNKFIDFDNTVLQPIKQQLTDAWNGFISFEWLGGSDDESSSDSGGSGIAKKLDPSSLLGDFDLTQWFDDNIKKPVMDWWNGFISFDWLPSFDISGLLNGFFGTGEDSSTTDSSTDSTTNPLVTWVNNNIVTPLTNFASDPLGTLSSWGLTLPQIDVGALLQGLFSIGGEGGFDIGGWLSSTFDISSIVSNFTNNLGVIFTTASGIASNVSGVFSNLKSMIWGHIQGILSNVTITFTNIKNTAVTQINGLRSGIQGGIDQVKSAFAYMKDSILDSAKKIYDGVKAKFDSVKTTIGNFWHKLTNPSSWGSAGSESYQKRSPKPHTARRMFSPVIRSATHHGAGINPYQNDSQSVKLKDLMDMVNGDNKVRLSDFLAMFSEGGFGTWDFHEPVKTKVFDTAKGYKTGSPNIKGIGTVGDGYKVGKFWDGKPSFSFDEFMTVAQAIFSAIPYKFYYDSEWKGNWVNALLSGAVNCSDGADALIALANVFGLSGYKQHTTLKSGVGHFFAVIGGKPMDTTNFQNHGSWSPLGGAGIPTRTSHSSRGAVQGNTTNHTVNVTITGDVYGVDDLESRIEEGVKRGLRDEFNDPYTVAI